MTDRQQSDKVPRLSLGTVSVSRTGTKWQRIGVLVLAVSLCHTATLSLLFASWQQIPGGGLWVPYPYNSSLLNSGVIIDASDEKVAYIGRVFFKEHTGSKTITKVHFRFGAVTKSGGSTVKVSLQDVDLTTGPPARPDGIVDQSYTILNADANFASSTWYPGAPLDVGRSVNFGDLFAVVFEFGSFFGTDSVTISAQGSLGNTPAETQVVLYAAAAWTLQTARPNIILEFSDGTFGTLESGIVTPGFFDYGTFAYNVNTAGADEYALEFSFPFPCKVDGAWVLMEVAAAGADFEVILYDGTTALRTVSIDANTFAATASNRMLLVQFAEVALAANTTYRFAIRPTTTNNVTVRYVDVYAAGHFQAYPGGTAFKYTSRLNQGAWASPTNTRRLLAGVRISSLDDATGGGGVRGRVIKK